MSEKSIMEIVLDKISWFPLNKKPTRQNKNLPLAIAYGDLKIGNIVLRVYQLNTGERVIEEKSLCEFFNNLDLGKSDETI